MAQRLSEQVVEWLTVGGNAFTPQNFNSTNGNIPLVVSKPGESVTIPATGGSAIGIYNNKGQLWSLGAVAATTSVKSGQLILSSSDAGNGSGVGLEFWRGNYTSWQLLGSSGTDGIFYIGNNSATTNKATYEPNVSLGYGAAASQYVHIYSTLDSNYVYGGASGSALSVAGGATFAKKVYINDATDSNYATLAGSFVTKGGAYITKKTYIADATDSNYATLAGALVVAGGANIGKKVYIKDATDSNYSTVAGSLVTAGGLYVTKKTYIADATDSNYSTLAGALVVAGGANFGKKVYLKDTTDSNYSTVAGSFVTMGGAYIKKKTYIADTTATTSYQTGALVVAGGVGIAGVIYNNDGFYFGTSSLGRIYSGSDYTLSGSATVITNDNQATYFTVNSTDGTYPWVYDATNAYWHVNATTLGTHNINNIVMCEWKALSNFALIIEASVRSEHNYDYFEVLVNDVQKFTTKGGSGTGNYSVSGNIYLKTNDIVKFRLKKDGSGEPSDEEYYRAILKRQSYSSVNTVQVEKDLSPTTTNTQKLGSSNLRWSKLYVGTADSYGSGTQPIYWSSGVPTASTSTVGSGTKPIYLSSGTITVSSSTAGGTAQPIYLSSGELKAISATVGSGVKPIYLSSGTLTVSSSTVGSGVKPVYLSSGEITVSSSTAGSSTMPVYLSSGEIKQITSYGGNISITETTPTSATTYYMVYVDGTSSARTLRANPHLYYYDNAPAGSSWLNIGNASEYGGLTLWNNGYHVDLRPVNTLSAVRTIEFPNVAGTVVLGSGTTNHITYFSGANTVAAAPNITHGNYSLTITDSGGQQPTFRLTGTSTDFGLLIGSGNTNKGIYSYTGSKWLLYWDSSDVGHLNSTLIPNANNTYSLGSSSAFWSNLYVNNIYLQRNGNAAYGRISFYKPDYKTWIMYMSNAASGACPSGGTPSTLGNVTSWALRSYIENSADYGWIWESAANSNTGAPTARMALSSNNGQLSVSGNIVLSNADISIQRAGRSKSWYNGRDGAILRLTSVNAYSPFISAKTKNGSWEFAVYDNASYQNQLLFGYVDDTRYSSGSPNAHAAQIRFSANGRIIFSSGQGYGSSTPSGGITGEVFFKTV